MRRRSQSLASRAWAAAAAGPKHSAVVLESLESLERREGESRREERERKEEGPFFVNFEPKAC
jgi:hypothetical protein